MAGDIEVANLRRQLPLSGQKPNVHRFRLALHCYWSPVLQQKLGILVLGHAQVPATIEVNISTLITEQKMKYSIIAINIFVLC